MIDQSARDERAGQPVLVAAAGVVGIVALFLVTAVAFVAPWGAVGDEGDALPVSRFALFEDGQASLVRRTTPEGELVEWSSVTVELVPGLRALGDLPRSFIDSVAEHIAGEGAGSNEALRDRDALSRARVGIVSKRVLRADGSTATEIEVRVLDRRGLYLLGLLTIGSEQSPTLIDPPLPLLPADPRAGTAWSAEGKFGATPYRWEAEVTDVGPLSVELGELDDCITASGTLTLELPDGPSPTEILDQYCANAGWVHGELGGSQPGRYDTVSVAGFTPVARPDPAGAGQHPFEPPSGDPGSWEFSRMGSALPLASIGAATFSPVYLPTEPPTVLAATEAGGDLVALAAGGVAGSVMWRFPTSGAVYAQPRFDPDTNRIYVGASDGVLRALDARGLFLWSSQAGDNIATRPVVSDGTVVFGSEDGFIQGLDADTGEPSWRVQADGAVVSSPTVHRGLVVVADESGVVRALDPLDGEERWRHTASSTVEAPIATCDRGVLVADRSGALTLLDDGGAEIWTADAGSGIALRSEPAVTGDLVVTVDELGEATGTSLVDGSVVWRRTGQGYAGSAHAAGGGAVLARDDGRVDVVGTDGELASQFDARDASTPSDLTPSFTYGPSPGGGALWMADDRGIVRRLGPAAETSSGRLEAAWVKPIVDPPFAEHPLVSTPLAWADRLVLFDTQRNLFVVDATTGEAANAGAFGTDGDVVLTEAVIVGDTMIVDVKVRLLAVDLTTGEELWSQPLAGQRFHPPVVAAGTVVTVTADGAGAAVEAFDLDDGERRWRRSTGAAALRSGPVAGEGVVFVGDPVTALDVETGEPLWASTVRDPAGLPVVGDRLLVVATNVDGQASGRMAGLEAGSGSVLWERETTGDAHGPTGRLVAAGGVVVLTSLSGPVIGIDPATGAELWRHRLPAPPIGIPSAIGDRVWYALQTGQVVALNAADGTVQLGFEGLGTSIGAISLVQRPAAFGDVVVIAAGSALYAVRGGGTVTTLETAGATGRRDPIRRAARFASDAVVGFGREFLWGSLRAGSIRLGGMPPAMRAVVVLSTALLVLTTISFAAGDLLRTGRELLVIPNGTPGRGSLVPGLLVPATFAIFAVGCALLLAGALHATVPVRLGVLLVYATVAAAFIGLASVLESTSGIPAWPGWMLTLAVIAVYAARWRARPRPAPEFALLLALVVGTLAISAAGQFRSDAITGNAFALQQLDLLLGLLLGLSFPLLLVAGLDTIGFGLEATTWLLRFLGRRLERWAVYGALGALVTWRLYDVVVRTVGDLRARGPGATLLPVVGAVVLVAAIWAYWWVLGRVAGRASRPGAGAGAGAGADTVEHASARVRLPLGIAYAGITFLLFPVLLLLDALSYFGVASDAAVFEGISTVVSFLGTDGAVTAYRVLLALVMVAVGVWLARRANTTLAIFIGAIGVSDLVAQLFANVDPLDVLLWDGPHPLDVAWLALFVGVGTWWVLRRSLTEARAERLFFLVLLSALLSHFDFIADPLAPVLGFAGIGFVVFGLVWGFLTGGGWTNQGSARFPRASRVYLYLGYSVLSMALLNWFSVTHDVGELSGMQATGHNGVTLLGYPLLYALFTLVLAGAITNRPLEKPHEAADTSARGAGPTFSREP